MSFRRDTSSRRTDRTTAHGCAGWAAARQDAEALQAGSRACLAVAGRGQGCPNGPARRRIFRRGGEAWREWRGSRGGDRVWHEVVMDEVGKIASPCMTCTNLARSRLVDRSLPSDDARFDISAYAGTRVN